MARIGNEFLLLVTIDEKSEKTHWFQLEYFQMWLVMFEGRYRSATLLGIALNMASIVFLRCCTKLRHWNGYDTGIKC